MIYRVTAVGTERLPRGGFLLLPNHITWVDAIVLLLACPRPIRFIIDQEYYRESISSSGPACGRLHPDHLAPGEGSHARCGGKDPRRRDCLPLPGRRIDPLRHAPAAAAGLRDHCATGRGSGRARLARPTLGLDLFLPRPALFHQMAATFSLSRDGRIRPAACAPRCRHRDGAGGIAQAGRALLQPPPGAARPSRRRRGARTGAASVPRRGYRRDGRFLAQSRQTSGGSGGLEPASARDISRTSHWHRPAREQGRRGREPRGRVCGQDPGRSEFYERERRSAAGAGNCGIENRHFRDRFYQTPEGFSVAGECRAAR